MKTKLLFACLCLTSLMGIGQVLDSQDNNALNLGDLTANVEGTAFGQGAYAVFGTNGDAPSTTTNAELLSSYQVVDIGENGTPGIQMTCPNGDAGLAAVFRPFAASLWDGRIPGNNILEIEFSFLTPGTTSSLSPMRAVVFGNDGTSTELIGGFEYDPATRELVGLARLNNGGTIGLFGLSLADPDIQLDPNTWYRLGFAYDTDTGELRWKTSVGSGTNGTFVSPALLLPGYAPNEFDFISFGVASNAAEVNYVFDNFQLSASAADTLSDEETQPLEITELNIFPNPAENQITLASNIEISEVSIYNTLGQKVLEKTSDFTSSTVFDISQLNSGIYLMNIRAKDQSIQVKRFVKK